MDLLLMLMTIGGMIVARMLFIVALYSGKIWLRDFFLGGEERFAAN